MKITGFVLAGIMLLGAAFVGVTGSNKSFDIGKEVTGYNLSDEDLAKRGIPSAGRLKFGGIAGIVAALCAVGLFVVSFVRKEKIPMMAVIALGLSLLAIVLYPGVHVEETAGLAPRPQAMVTAVLTLLGTVGALIVKKTTDR